MKKNTIVAFVFIFIAGIAIVGCDTPGQKVENAQNDVAEANRNLRRPMKSISRISKVIAKKLQIR